MRKTAQQLKSPGLVALRFLVNPMIRGATPVFEGEGGPVGTPAAPGNPATESTPAQVEDYASKVPDFKQFWEQPVEPQPQAQPAPQTPPANQTNPNQQFAEGIQAQIGKIDFGNVITPEVQAALNNGDFAGLNTGIQTSLRNALSQSVQINAQVVQQFGRGLLAEVQRMISESGTQRDTRDQLEQNFPVVKDPAVRPIVESIYNQALVRNKGNHELAVKETKGLLGHVATQANTVPGVTDPPASAESNAMTDNSKDLVAALLRRA